MVTNNQTDLFQSTAPLTPQILSDAQRIDWLRLMRSKNIGAVTFRDLLNHFGNAQKAIEALEQGKISNKRFKLAPLAPILHELEMAEKFGAKIVALGEAGYPRWLQSIDAAPPLLYVKGQLSLAQRPAIGIVGSRNASGAGLKFAKQMSHEFSRQGLVITSGLARGIDAAAHLGAIESGTIAVLGGGIDHIYPAQNEEIYHKIAADGLLISERPIGFYAQPKDFPRRNRLISGISLGTIVIEAALRSGSLTTARFASEQGREVFAVPGHPLDPRATGTNKLIQNGATLITKSQDVIEALKTQIEFNDLPFSSHSTTNAFFENTPDPINPEGHLEETGNGEELKINILNLLGSTPIERDSLQRLLKCSARNLQIALLELDLDGMIDHHGHQRISKSVS